MLPSRLDVDSYHQEVGGKIAGISGNIVIPQRRLSCSDPHSHHASTKLVKTPPSSCSRLSGYECLMRSPTNRRTIIGSPTCTKRTAACTTNLPNLRRRLEQGGAKFCEGYLVDPALADEKGFERGSYLRSHLLNLASK